MIDTILSKFQSFRNRLFQLFHYRAGATMDLIDTLSATTADSIVKLSLSHLFRRKYSSLTDVLSSVFRTNLKMEPTVEERQNQTIKVTQLLAEECVSNGSEGGRALFAIDCTANPRVYANKVDDRSFIHAPNHIPGQKPITVGHEYSFLVHLPNQIEDKELHWVVPLNLRRVESDQSGPQVGLLQLEEISNQTVFKSHFCISVADTAYSTRSWVIGVSKLPNVVHIARMRGNRKVYRMPHMKNIRRGRPQIYGNQILLQDPSEPDLEEITSMTNRKGKEYQVLLQRWNDVILQGSKEERTHEHPLDLLRVTVTDNEGNPVYRRPLWVMITGARRREVSSKDAHIAYGRRYDIEHFFRFGKQKLGLVNSQTCETRHEENWHWMGLLAYNMLYHARKLTQSERYPWEKKKIRILSSERPSQVHRGYGGIIQRIGTPAPIPKPRGKSSGRREGCKAGERPDRPLIRKSLQEKDSDHGNQKKPARPRNRSKRPQVKYRSMKRIRSKNRPQPLRC